MVARRQRAARPGLSEQTSELGINKQTKLLLALIAGICIGLMFDKNFVLF